MSNVRKLLFLVGLFFFPEAGMESHILCSADRICICYSSRGLAMG